MRGADEQKAKAEEEARRFIPTCVGQMSRRQKPKKKRGGSSPRAWGRCSSTVTPSAEASGSSPRAWGRCHCAVNTTTKRTVHPHVRGADHGDHHCPKGVLRFIPTCVGQMNRSHEGDCSGQGSSPRAWGRCVDNLSELERCIRFIPTCVGQILKEMALLLDFDQLNAV